MQSAGYLASTLKLVYRQRSIRYFERDRYPGDSSDLQVVYRGSGDTTSGVLSTSNTLDISGLTSTTKYWVQVSINCGYVNSDTATVTVGASAGCITLINGDAWNHGNYSTFPIDDRLKPRTPNTIKISVNLTSAQSLSMLWRYGDSIEASQA